jgi:hypothetical protein
MFAKLVTVVLAAAAFSAHAEGVPLSFENTSAARTWFSKTYSSHEMMKYAIKAPQGGNEIYAFYGPRGSGIGRLDVWFYSCIKASACNLFAMTTLGRAEDITQDPSIQWQEPYLIIKSGKKVLAKIRG